MKKFFVLIFLLITILLVAGFWYWQNNYYSKDILKLEILGPAEAETSQEVEYVVKYKNNGNIRLEEPRLIFEFPDYSIPAEEFLKRNEIGPDKLGAIYPGEEKTFTFKGRLFGKEGEAKKAKAYLSYQPKNLKTRYESQTTFTTLIKFTPISLDFDFPSKIEGGREFKFSLNYFSNSNYPLANLGVKINYPEGFEFISSSPKSVDKIQWDIPMLNKTEGGRIEIRGRLLGEIKDKKVFRAFLGIWVGDEFVPLKETVKGIEISKPNIYVFQRINDKDNYIASPGEMLHYEIYFRNIGEEPFNELFLVSKLDGKAFDFNSIRTQFGQVNKAENSIMWDWRDIEKLRLLEPGEEGKVEFWVKVKNEWQMTNSKDNILSNNVLISQIKEVFETKINSKLAFSQKVYFYDDFFGNSGPLPPKVGQNTTYTIVWQIKNYLNDLKNVKVRATLPSNVNLTGKFLPEEEKDKFVFDNTSREIIWNVSNDEVLPAGTGVSNNGPYLVIQVSLLPNQDQIGQNALIIKEAKITAEDQFTGETIESIAPAVDTSLPDDDRFDKEMGKVVQ